jgi:hypothetical protein
MGCPFRGLRFEPGVRLMCVIRRGRDKWASVPTWHASISWLLGSQALTGCLRTNSRPTAAPTDCGAAREANSHEFNRTGWRVVLIEKQSQYE